MWASSHGSRTAPLLTKEEMRAAMAKAKEDEAKRAEKRGKRRERQ